MDRVTATDTEPCFLMDSSYADRHSKRARSKGLCKMTNEEYALLTEIVLKRYARWSVNEWPLTVWYGAGNTCTIIISLYTYYDTNQDCSGHADVAL